MNSLPGSYIAVGHISDASSACKNEPLPSLFATCDGAMQFNNRYFLYGDRLIRTNPHWIRDYVLCAKSFRYTEKDLVSFPDLLLEHQHESGFFYEILAPMSEMHSGFHPMECEGRMVCLVEEPYRLHEEGTAFGLSRIELEADIEYLMVEGCYLIWQATGDDEWLLRQMPRLEKGLRYMTTSPVRWDGQYQLAKRPHTLDTWDFTDRKSSQFDRMIRPEDPMGIFHGDNTGLYYAKQLMSRLYEHFGDTAAATRHREEAEALRTRIMKHLWNGDFFRHFLKLDPCDYGVDEERQMSLSNAYALNRGLLTLAEKRRVIDSYRAMRKKYGGELDDFRNLDPPFGHYFFLTPGSYMNGGVAPFVAGQLALGAFEAGEEEYGADILHRIGCKFLQDGKVSFLYNWKGEDIAGGPRCWCGAEIMHAMVAGLAGVVDEGKLFRRVTLSPRFAAAGEDHAVVRLEYAASGAAVEYAWKNDEAAGREEFKLLSSHEECTLRLFVPSGKRPVEVRRNGLPAEFADETVVSSHYAVVRNLAQGEEITLLYQ